MPDKSLAADLEGATATLSEAVTERDVPAGNDFCYWVRLSGFSGEFNDIITNDFSSGPGTVSIQASDAGFTSQGCGTWELQD